MPTFDSLGPHLEMAALKKEAKRKQGRNNKRKGQRNEYRTMRYYQAMGGWCVRASGSFGLFDVLAFLPDSVHLVQVKSNRWPSPAEREKISQFVSPFYARKIILRWDDRSRIPHMRVIP